MPHVPSCSAALARDAAVDAYRRALDLAGNAAERLCSRPATTPLGYMGCRANRGEDPVIAWGLPAGEP
jgi:hypothetical protein